jgi:nucleoside-diphosphate kinase
MLKLKPFFSRLVKYITYGPMVCMAWESQGIIVDARKLIGATNPLQVEPSTIRDDLEIQFGRKSWCGRYITGLWYYSG